MTNSRRALGSDPPSSVAAVITDAELEEFLYRSGMAPQSVEAYRPKFPRWTRHLTAAGIDHVPSPLSTSPADTMAVNELCLLARQGAKDRNASIEHNLRDVTGIRPFKG
jgi:hypothetical protein